MNIDAFQYLDILRPIALALPGMTEGTSFGTPAFHVNKKFVARMKEDGITLVIRTWEREKWIRAKPAVYYFTDHYLNYPGMLVRLSKVSQKDLEALFLAAWKKLAPKRLLKEREEENAKKEKRRTS